MSWLDEALACLAARPCGGYHADGPPATEPTALTAMALWAYGHRAAAETALGWLTEIQSADGSVPIDASQKGPGWATGWAVLAWRTALSRRPLPAGAQAWAAAADRAVRWVLAAKGRALPQSPLLGHDMSLVAWAWAEGSSSWVEPTAIQLLALKSAGFRSHQRCREAVQLLRDRAVPSGGWNCGNKVVFGTPLRAHVQPTGLALAALVGETSAEAEVRPAIDYLHKAISPSTTTVSLSYALIGLAGHGQRPKAADARLAAACGKSLRDGASPYTLALAALAALGSDCPWYAAERVQGSGFRVRDSVRSLSEAATSGRSSGRAMPE